MTVVPRLKAYLKAYLFGGIRLELQGQTITRFRS